MIHQTDAGVVLDVRVIPRAHTSQLAGTRGDAILIRLAAPPVDGAANDALIHFLADALSVPQRAVQVTKGARSRIKRVTIAGVTEAEVRAALLA